MNLTRKLFHIIAEHFDWKYTDADQFLSEHFYPDAKTWQQYLKIFLLAMGVGFGLLGVVYFFAYNWDDLHKFAKISLVASLILVLVVLWFLFRTKELISNIFITAACVMVGVLFAVFGQIYQTGANAFDFFMAWALFTTIWVIVTDFAPLWLIYAALLNTTYILYMDQVVGHKSNLETWWIWALLNLILFGILKTLQILQLLKGFARWLEWILGLLILTLTTLGLCVSIVDNREQDNWLGFYALLCVTVYTLGIWYGILKRELFYLGAIPFSILMVLDSLVIKAFDDHFDAGIFLILSIVTLAGTTILIRTLIVTQKKWSHENV